LKAFGSVLAAVIVAGAILSLFRTIMFPAAANFLPGRRVRRTKA
jgi:hypothetical protein